jgi:hypothetical protein
MRRSPQISAESPLQVCENQRLFSAGIRGKYSTAGSTTLIVKISEVFSAVCAFVEYFPQIFAEKNAQITAESPLQVCENQRLFSAEIRGKYSTAGSTTLIVKISEVFSAVCAFVEYFPQIFRRKECADHRRFPQNHPCRSAKISVFFLRKSAGNTLRLVALR